MKPWAFVLGCVLTLTTSVAAYSDTPSINSTSGLIIGHRAPDRRSTFEFLGIKYGQAPIGDLRFAPPQRYIAAPNTVYNASTWNADCPANAPPETTFPNFTRNGLRIWNEFAAHLNNTQNEDCLALNIWTKSPSNMGHSSKPVFVFFHGGRFTIPGPHSPFYNGQYFADTEDVVVITISYRLGIFGFSGVPGLVQNVALLDQRAAVEWVRDNIAGFGGDPKRITLFGQSAGGSSVDYWPFAYRKAPIVAGLISHSGTAFSFVPNSVNYSQTLFYNVSNALGCGNVGTSPASAVSCVRSKNFTDVLRAAGNNVTALPTQALAQATFHPTVDSITVFADYTPLSDSGAFARIPYLAGNADYEAGWYRISAYAAHVNLSEAAWELFVQRGFTCPTKYSLDARVKYGVPTWRYRYMADWDNLRLYNATPGYPDSGAYHGSDMEMIFGTDYEVSGQNNSLQEELTSRYFMSAWAAFGRSPTRGLDIVGWPKYSANSTSLARLGYENQAIPSFVDPGVYDDVCPPVSQDASLPGRGGF